MKIIKRYERLLFFSRRNLVDWLGVWLQYDYHNMIFCVNLLTIEIGVEYIYRKSDFSIKKNSFSFNVVRKK